jgi:hypothetical protein
MINWEGSNIDWIGYVNGISTYEISLPFPQEGSALCLICLNKDGNIDEESGGFILSFNIYFPQEAEELVTKFKQYAEYHFSEKRKTKIKGIIND